MTDYRARLLHGDYAFDEFDCGVGSLNTWLKNDAIRAHKAGAASVHVWLDPDDRVVAYYALAATQLARAAVGGAMAGGYTVIPGYLIARLALDRSLHGQGLGGDLLFDAVEVAAEAASRGGGRLVVVDALDEHAAAFYRYHGFRPVRDRPLRLVAKISSIRAMSPAPEIRVDADARASLITMELRLPHGETVPIVMSPAEADAIAGRFQELLAAKAKEGPDAQISIRDVISDVLGRDPFAE